ncbi:MAG TPA: ABC transporter substrate-binding protein [Xanthobacteraceae bacterium]|jgi:putative ABC transport system substrate-binding protein
MAIHIGRRHFFTIVGGAAAWPLAAHAQQPAMPVIGFLRSTPSARFMHFVTAFQQGLKEEGFAEGQNVSLEYRWADNQLDRLPGLADELVQRHVAVIVGNTQAAKAAKTATRTIPIIFVSGEDPVTIGLVASLNRPTDNVTGIVFFSSGHLGAKRMELLCELAPKAVLIAVLMDPNFATELPAVEQAGRALGRQILVVKAASEGELDAAFAQMVRAGAGALVVGGGPFFMSQRQKLTARAARYAIPAIYDAREHVEAGGLMSYGTSIADAYRHAGLYTGRILKGAKTSELPVMQPTTFELVINRKTAKMLALTIPQTLLVAADEIIE